MFHSEIRRRLFSWVLFLVIISSNVYGQDDIPKLEGSLLIGKTYRILLSTDTLHNLTISINSKDAPNIEGFIFQAHSQRNMITLSESPELSYGSFVKGTHIGLWKLVTESDDQVHHYSLNISCSMYCDGRQENVTVLVAAVPVNISAPIPGGCTMTSSLETDPNIRLNYTSYTTSLLFEDGNVGYNPHQDKPWLCEKTYLPSDEPTFKRVSYSIYHKVLPTGDYSEELMFSAIEDLLTASSISNEKDLPKFGVGSTGVKQAIIDSYTGDGVVYNVVAEVSGAPSGTAYVPAATYSCEFVAGSNECHLSLETVKIVVAVLTGLTGLFLNFLAHRLFNVEVFIFSSVLSMFLWYLVIAHIPLFDVNGISVLVTRLLVSLILSLLTGGLLFFVWFFTGWYLPSVLLFSASAGFLLMATMMYALSFTIVDTIAILKISYIYFLLFGCLIVLVMIPAVIFPRGMNIVSSSMVGSYLVVFSIALVLYSSVSEILMRVIKNATVSGYMKTEASYPFQIKDIALVLAWVVLICLGFIVQGLLAYKRKPFPETSPYKQCKQKFNKTRMGGTVNERKQLLSSYPYYQ